MNSKKTVSLQMPYLAGSSLSPLLAAWFRLLIVILLARAILANPVEKSERFRDQLQKYQQDHLGSAIRNGVSDSYIDAELTCNSKKSNVRWRSFNLTISTIMPTK
jgi:hypothetical protein